MTGALTPCLWSLGFDARRCPAHHIGCASSSTAGEGYFGW